TMIWQPEFTDKTLSRKPGAVQRAFPRVVKERPWKYPTAPKKSQSVA
ncbi:hypothetical protein, partial [Shigella flexneri]|nr:hypothetical protein [Shigella flexneri]